MIVSVWSNLPLLENQSKIKKHLKNAVEYAISEGGRMFLSEAGTEFSALFEEIMEEYQDVVYMPVDKTEAESSAYCDMSYHRKSSVKSYLSDKADIVIVIETRENIISKEFPKTTLRIKI